MLFPDPTQQGSNAPVLDGLTLRITAAIRNTADARSAVSSGTNQVQQLHLVRPTVKCGCGCIRSEAKKRFMVVRDTGREGYLDLSPFVIHTVAFHRGELSSEAAAWIMTLPDRQANPTEAELFPGADDATVQKAFHQVRQLRGLAPS